jgi:protein-S-isoprenylcysteine O-methyltransferase Ste14
MLILKSVLFTVIVPGTVTILIPYFLLQGSTVILGHWIAQQVLGLIAILLGAAILLWCVWDFALIGRGTLADIDPPKELVVQGLYRYVRNPMYLGVLVLLLGEAAFFHSATLLRYAAGFLVIIHISCRVVRRAWAAAPIWGVLRPLLPLCLPLVARQAVGADRLTCRATASRPR